MCIKIFLQGVWNCKKVNIFYAAKSAIFSKMAGSMENAKLVHGWQ